MSLSKKNLNELSKLLNQKKADIQYNPINSKSQRSSNPRVSNPNDIFYSLIDDSEELIDTTKVNDQLRKAEIANNIYSSHEKNNYLTDEEKLYVEFNSLLDE